MDQRAKELLEHGLNDMYDAEKRFAESLQKMERNADDNQLAKSFRRHREVTLKQVKRIEDAFREMGAQPEGDECKAAVGLVAEYDSFVEEHAGGNGLLDAFAATAGLKVEHYEIASYRALINLAEFCDEDAVAKLLAQTLVEEEQGAAEMMTAATTLSAKLAGASATKVATRAASSMIGQAREGTLNAIGGVVATAGRAVDRVGGRSQPKAKGKAKAKGKPTAKAKAPARKARSGAKSTARKAKSSARAGTRKAKSSARRATSTPRKAKTTAKRRSGATSKRGRSSSR